MLSICIYDEYFAHLNNYRDYSKSLSRLELANDNLRLKRKNICADHSEGITQLIATLHYAVE